MATTIKTALTEAWAEVADGPALIVLVSGIGFWAYNGTIAPTNDASYIPVTPEDKYYSYSGTEKTFAKVSTPVSRNSVLISVTEIV